MTKFIDLNPKNSWKHIVSAIDFSNIKFTVIIKLWAANLNSHMHMCEHIQTCVMCEQNCFQNVYAMYLHVAPFSSVRRAIAILHAFGQKHPFSLILGQ